MLAHFKDIGARTKARLDGVGLWKRGDWGGKEWFWGRNEGWGGAVIVCGIFIEPRYGFCNGTKREAVINRFLFLLSRDPNLSLHLLVIVMVLQSCNFAILWLLLRFAGCCMPLLLMKECGQHISPCFIFGTCIIFDLCFVFGASNMLALCFVFGSSAVMDLCFAFCKSIILDLCFVFSFCICYKSVLRQWH